MSASLPTSNPSQSSPESPSRAVSSKGPVIRAAAVIIGLVLLGSAFAVGAAVGQSPIPGYKRQVAQLRGEVSTQRGTLLTEQGRLSAAQSQVQTAQAAAKNAMSTALAQVQAQYKSRLASVQSLQRQLQREQGIVQKSTISADGVYVVGKDIPAGNYHTTGMNQCYYATLGSTDTSNILDNNNFNGPETVDVSGAYAFQIQGGCTWVKVG
ncbi:MAG TPA: hypothetical protein VGS19_08355 [Streptosporangiaceae bacterium]|nr:hypothetical protein [Streptosporangiaceae bacterium]